METELHYMIGVLLFLSVLMWMVSIGTKPRPPRYRR
jgi:hypothetical protein